MLPLWDVGPTGKFPYWVVAIITINILVFYLELTTQNPDAFIAQYSLIPSMVSLFNIPTLLPFITSQFLHGGFLHIITNMWFFWIFGDNVEYRLGSYFFPIFYLGSGIAGNILQYLFVRSSDIPMLGASGAIAGVLGAYFALFPQNKVKTLIFILFFVTIVDVSASLIIFYWLVLQLFNSAIAVSPIAINSGGIAYFAHIGGFVLGWTVGKIITWRKSHDGQPQFS